MLTIMASLFPESVYNSDVIYATRISSENHKQDIADLDLIVRERGDSILHFADIEIKSRKLTLLVPTHFRSWKEMIPNRNFIKSSALLGRLWLTKMLHIYLSYQYRSLVGVTSASGTYVLFLLIALNFLSMLVSGIAC